MPRKGKGKTTHEFHRNAIGAIGLFALKLLIDAIRGQGTFWWFAGALAAAGTLLLLLRLRFDTTQRKQDVKAAGGKHTREEIDAVLELQKGRCIYCNALFTAAKRPTRDHLVPLFYGGTAWPLNLVLACHSCNSRRGEIPFRTFCRLLSPRQNERILQHLFRRISAIDFENPPDGYEDFETGLRMHLPNDSRYRMILSMKRRYRENARRNKLLPLGAIGILKEMARRQRAEPLP